MNITAENIDDLSRGLRALSRNWKKEEKGILRKAARPLVSEIKSRAPVGKKAHRRYKGGQIAAIYKPGNLRRSFAVLPLRKSKSVFVGPRVDKGKKGVADGYYAHFVEFGTSKTSAQPFIRPAWSSAKAKVLEAAKNGFVEILKKY